ncbi:hypothetical protein PVL30_001361 [Lodderomyces elongisporus]|uniref:uncharacterized protein n=1 Tax=Lodderomyces elongisporus TaxID=36914 RepID=UPI00291DA845|nr:uncharacterized protein PVL30_001361 [Lodderomyces elongisporus]WLF77644.1 hypothetical protein PVL30_001361 [Lodderomyces elongisporus]
MSLHTESTSGIKSRGSPTPAEVMSKLCHYNHHYHRNVRAGNMHSDTNTRGSESKTRFTPPPHTPIDNNNNHNNTHFSNHSKPTTLTFNDNQSNKKNFDNHYNNPNPNLNLKRASEKEATSATNQDSQSMQLKHSRHSKQLCQKHSAHEELQPTQTSNSIQSLETLEQQQQPKNFAPPRTQPLVDINLVSDKEEDNEQNHVEQDENKLNQGEQINNGLSHLVVAPKPASFNQMQQRQTQLASTPALPHENKKKHHRSPSYTYDSSLSSPFFGPKNISSSAAAAPAPAPASTSTSTSSTAASASASGAQSNLNISDKQDPFLRRLSEEEYENLPLSIKFIHKPSRSRDFFAKSNDPTKANSILNKKITLNDDENKKTIRGNEVNASPGVSPKLSPKVSPTTTGEDSRSPRIEQGHGNENDNHNNSLDYFNHKPQVSREEEEEEEEEEKEKENTVNHQLKHQQISPPIISTSTSTSPTPATNSPNMNPLLSPLSQEYRLVRKKSGELVKPSLKSPSMFNLDRLQGRPKSLPATPTYKQVHFGGATNVKYFKKKDTPSAISASNSPLASPDSSTSSSTSSTDDEYENEDYGNDIDDTLMQHQHLGHHRHFHLHNFSLGDTKYPSSSPGNGGLGSSKSGLQPTWELQLTNFPPLSYLRRIEQQTPVFLERLFISGDKKYLMGHIAVRNLAFEKFLTVRYSVDNWMTIIEIPTKYTPDKIEVLKQNNYDRFVFKIPLNNMFNSFKYSKNTSSTDSLMDDEDDVNISNDGSGAAGFASEESAFRKVRKYQLCIKYYAQGAEFWDNNDYKNYEIKLIKSITPPPASPSHLQKQKGSRNPSSKNSKIQEHAKKPRYSSSYLKRVMSDSELELSNGNSNNAASVNNSNNSNNFEPMAFEQGFNSIPKSPGSDTSDFINNNYYLSSPLLSSIYNSNTKSLDGKYQDVEEYLRRNDNSSNGKSITHNNQNPESKNIIKPPIQSPLLPEPKYKTKFRDQLNLEQSVESNNPPNTSTGSNNENNSGGSKTIAGGLMNTKSYKELLDNYCFFSTGSGPDSGVGTEEKTGIVSPTANEDLKTREQQTFTVSSFLGT